MVSSFPWVKIETQTGPWPCYYWTGTIFECLSSSLNLSKYWNTLVKLYGWERLVKKLNVNTTLKTKRANCPFHFTFNISHALNKHREIFSPTLIQDKGSVSLYWKDLWAGVECYKQKGVFCNTTDIPTHDSYAMSLMPHYTLTLRTFCDLLTAEWELV